MTVVTIGSQQRGIPPVPYILRREETTMTARSVPVPLQNHAPPAIGDSTIRRPFTWRVRGSQICSVNLLFSLQIAHVYFTISYHCHLNEWIDSFKNERKDVQRMRHEARNLLNAPDIGSIEKSKINLLQIFRYISA